jgi:16S rRNA (uracil1498-N3)-methyltransferase
VQLFFSQDISDNEIILRDQEAIHCAKVLRKSVSDQLNILDGLGRRYTGVIIELKKAKVTLSNILLVEESKDDRAKPSIAVGLLKNSTRMEWLIEKAVEIGVNEITLMNCKRSERSKVNLDRLNKIALSAMKQSKQLWLPKLTGPVKMGEYLKSVTGSDCVIANYAPDHVDLTKVAADESKTIIIGPEGDFTEDEIRQALNVGCKPVNLGVSRLRTETAGLVALTIMNNKMSVSNIDKI